MMVEPGRCEGLGGAVDGACVRAPRVCNGGRWWWVDVWCARVCGVCVCVCLCGGVVGVGVGGGGGGWGVGYRRAPGHSK